MLEIKAIYSYNSPWTYGSVDFLIYIDVKMHFLHVK